MRRTTLAALAALTLAAVAACTDTRDEQRAPMPTAPAFDQSPPTTPPDTTSRGGPLLGGGG